jgi:membrane-bound lytic murein transglycosylase F
MRNLFRVAIPALTLVSVQATGEDLAEIRARGRLRVLVVPLTATDEFFSDQASRPGLDREVLEGFCALQHLKLHVVTAPGWGALIPALREGKGDVIAGRFTATEARRKVIDFTLEVFPTRDAVFTRKPHRIVRTLEELRAEKVGTIKGSSMAEAVAAAGVPRANIDDSIPPGGLPEALKQGRVSAAVLGVESIILAQQQDPDLQLGLFLGRSGSLAYGVRKDEPELLKALNEYIDNVRRSQMWSRLVVKYFGEQAQDVLRKARAE